MSNQTKIQVAVFVLCTSILPMQAQTCKELFRKAETLRKSEKYDAAIATYHEVKGCSDKSYGKDCDYAIRWINENRPQKKAIRPTTFGLSTNEVRLPYQGGEWTVRVYGSGAWTYSVDGDWCQVKKSGNQLIVSSPEENQNRQQRKATIKVQSGGKSHNVEVVKDAAPEKLRSSVNNLSFPAEGESIMVTIDANTNWEIAEKPDWVSAQKEDNMQGDNLRFVVEANPQSRERRSTVKIVSPSNASITIYINQGAGNEKLVFSKNDISFGPDGGDEYVKIYTDAPSWNFANMPHWIQVSRVTDNMIKIHCAPNAPINEKREGSVNITTGLQAQGINIIQEPKPVSYLIPMPSIGGRKLSFGMSASYVIPSISTTASSDYCGSVVSYALGNSQENSSFASMKGFSLNAFADIHLYRNFYLQAGLGIIHYTYNNSFEATVSRTFPQTTNIYYAGPTQNSYVEDYSMTMLEVPVLASYRFPISKISHLQLNLGPMVNFGLSAKMKLSGYTDSETLRIYEVKTNQQFGTAYETTHYSGKGEMDLYDSSVDYTETHQELGELKIKRSQTLDDSPLSRLNVGLRAGAMFEYAGIGFGVEYTYMLTNMANKKFWEGPRWKIFDQQAPIPMSGYKEHHHYLGIRVGYTFRY